MKKISSEKVACDTDLRQPSLWFPLTIIFLALATVASTVLPSELQQNATLLGMPVILWFWFGCSLLSVSLTTLAAWQVISEKTYGGSDD